jgi:protease IV
MTLFDCLKTVLLLTILIYTTPMIIEGIKKQYIPILELRTHIGIIHITETLSNSYRHTAELHTFFRNPQIKGIVIKMNCLGGAAGTSQTIFHEIRHLKKEFPKPVIALVENNCVAGGYLVASACDYIIAPESAIIGNIGPDFIKTEHIKEDQALLTALHEDAYQQLTKQIAAARKLSLTTTANWAEGKIFTGHQAVSLGLINEVGSMCTVIKIIKEKALIEGEIEWIESKKECHLKDMFSISSLVTNAQ